MGKRVCLLFGCHGWSDVVQLNAMAYAYAARGLCDFHIVYHDANGRPPPSGAPLAAISTSEIFDAIPHSKEGRGRVLPGNADLVVLSMCRRFPGYDCYIRVEYDVVAVADLRAALARLIDLACAHDLGGSFFMDDHAGSWPWWNSLHIPDVAASRWARYARRAFFPIMSLSSGFVELYERALAQDWDGHYEVLAPTLAQRHRRGVIDFSSGPAPLTSYPQFQALRPERIEAATCAFVHPVKTMEAYVRTRRREAAR